MEQEKEAMYEGKLVKVLDLTPTWEAVLPGYLIVLEDGNDTGKKAAKMELRNMAKVADAYVALTKSVRGATNFDFRISKEVAIDLIRPNDRGTCLKDEMGIEIMCKEMGEDDDWVGIETDDIENVESDASYQTFEVWLPVKRDKPKPKYNNPEFGTMLKDGKPFVKNVYGYTIEESEDRGGHFWKMEISDMDNPTDSDGVVMDFEYKTKEEAEEDIETANANTSIDFQGI